MKNKLIACIFALVFFIFGLTTLPDYGINWDTINHLPRGQAYFHYFLTGNKDFSDLVSFFNGWQVEGQWYWQNPNKLGIESDLKDNFAPQRSLYQNDSTTFDYFMEKDGDGHPPLSDILSSIFNLVFFNKLKIVNDIDSYRLYGIVLSAILVGIVYFWSASIYGPLAGIISALSISLYPLFLAESHFNTEKDIPETVFWSIMFFFIWRGIKNSNWKLIIISGIFFGLALGTKFNILFSIFAIIPWLLLVLWNENNKHYKKGNLIKLLRSKMWIIWSSLFAITIGFSIFVFSWPYLWPDLITRTGKVFGFYKNIGLSSDIQSGFLGIDFFAVEWILFTTPIVILVFFIFSLFAVVFWLKGEKKETALLFLFWFLVPVIRSIWPGTSIYGGVRQLMEFIPAMALLSGIGASYLINLVERFLKIKRKQNLKYSFLILLLFVPLVVKLVKIHPNENVYFNSLIGGLSGAKEKNFPYWGFSFGSPYRQAAMWLNENTEETADVVYTYELIPNLPRIWLRQDINLYNVNRSGFLSNGEYAMSLIYQGVENRSYYDSFLERFIEPVYEVKVDNVSILKIWKNDKEHYKKEINEVFLRNVTFEKKPWGIAFDLKKEVPIWRLEINYQETNYCKTMQFGYVQISSDGKSWERLPGVLPDDWRVAFLGEQPNNGLFIEPFLGQNVRYVDVAFSPEDSCLMNIKSFKFYILEE